jgi:glycosyltransferase involved in cell wall biosynthesis
MYPKVSVIMPMFNAEKYVGQAIDSILQQSYRNFELIIVNDCPTDRTMDIVKGYQDERIKIINNEKNQGISYSRNVALANSKGKYIAIMDNDDISLPDRLAVQVEFMESHQHIGIVAGGARIIDEMGKVLREPARVLNNPQFIKAIFLFRNLYQNSEVMLRRDLIERHKIRYQEGWLGMEDYRFWIECSKVIPMSGIKDTVLLYRERSDSEGTRIRKDREQQRKEKYAELQRFSLELSGFHLEEGQWRILTSTYCEYDQRCQDWTAVNEFHSVLVAIVKQAELLGMDNSAEIRIVCRQILCQMINCTGQLF